MRTAAAAHTALDQNTRPHFPTAHHNDSDAFIAVILAVIVAVIFVIAVPIVVLAVGLFFQFLLLHQL